MKRTAFLLLFALLCVAGQADIVDAFRSAQPLDSAKKGIWPVTDRAMMRSLNGTWQLKVIKGVTKDQSVPAADASWGTIPVPGCWEPHGFCKPKYDYPDSLTGYYCTEFSVPREWKGQRIVLRFDGVLRGYDLWINDQLAGTWESAYNTCLFDITPYLNKKGPQQLAMRVYSHFKGYEFDCFDDWATMGIFRDVTLFAVPETHLSDLTVTTRMNGEVMVKTAVANATKHTTTSYEILDAQGKVVSTGGHIPNPHLWTAETPYLYTLRVYVKEKNKTLQTFTQKIGIKEWSIEGRSDSPLDSVKNVLKLNGQPIKLRGVNAHSTDPQTVKVISDDLTLKDMHMMKEASVNYMRLSHYPREPRFYELADSLGFYLVSEVPFGYGDKHLSSRKYQDILMTRANATVRRDKNHPSVLVWSVGNENPLPQTCVEVGDYVQQLDPSRPYCFPQVGSYFRRFWENQKEDDKAAGKHPFPSKAPIYAPHYPNTSQMGGFYQHLDRPVIFTEYCHTLGTSFEDHDRQWEIIERTPGIAGGSVWEWADQGMPFNVERLTLNVERQYSDSATNVQRQYSDSAANVQRSYGYEERVFTSPDGGFEMYGNKGTDGLVYADRTPLPNYYELQRNYARAFVYMEKGMAAYDRVTVYQPDDRFPVVGEPKDQVYLRITNRYDFLNLHDNVFFHWALTADRDTIARGTFTPGCEPHSSVVCGLRIPETSPQAFTIVHYDIEDKDGHTFLHQSFVLNKPEQHWTGNGDPLSLVQQGPLVRAGRKPTLAERIKQEGRLPEKYLLPVDNDQVKADIISEPLSDSGRDITFTLTPDTADVFRAELGLAWLLDPSIDRVQWIGQGPFASYPGRHQACRYGFWAKHKDDLYFEGNHSGVDAALLTDKDGNGLLITGEGLDLNFEQTDRGLVLTVNAAVSGLGPKFAKTAFNGWKPGDGLVSASFRIYRVQAGSLPRLFLPAADVPAPFHPFTTQYDTYLMRYSDIRAADHHSLRQSFLTPPDSIRVGCYYYWVNECVDPKGVVADLQWMKQNGITLAFLATDIRNRDRFDNPWEGQTFGKNKFQSRLWWKNLRTALKTAGELDIEMGLFNCPGWSQSGGPWVKPEEAMRNWTPTSIEVCKTTRGDDVVNGPCSPEAEGLEVDKLSKAHVQKHFESFIGEILRRIPPKERPTLTTVVVDSWERGKQNYTDSIYQRFRQRFGYELNYNEISDPKSQTSNHLNQLISDMVASEYMGGLTRKAHEYGLRTWCEPYAHSPFPGNGITYGSAADEVAAEFWVNDTKYRNKEVDAALGAARRSGKNRVWAESFTDGRWGKDAKDDWSFEKLKPIADRYFHAGINATILHVMISQPGDPSQPPVRPWFGTFFDRRSQHAADLKPLVQYLRRCNFMLQLGRPYNGATDQRIMDDGTIIRFTDDSQFQVTFPDGLQETWNPSPLAD